MLRVWEYDVPENARPEFELVYDAHGPWAQLFALSAAFDGTELFVSTSRPGRYLTIDRFQDEAGWQQFLTEHGEDYRRLDEQTAGLATTERELVGPGEVGSRD
jgi:hypothetical protein